MEVGLRNWRRILWIVQTGLRSRPTTARPALVERIMGKTTAGMEVVLYSYVGIVQGMNRMNVAIHVSLIPVQGCRS
jgi:hypothetical protein